MKRLIIMGITLMLMAQASAQSVEIQHDTEKEKQWRSMETGGWDFAPDWYYYFLHKDYSGAYLSWKWRGLKSSLGVSFRESKSNVRTILPRRVASELIQQQKLEKVRTEEKKIDEIKKEEVERAADRNVDLVYSSFSDDFDRMQKSITDGLRYCLDRSRGNLRYQVTQLSRQNAVIQNRIDYIHEMGVGYELENAKREKAYMEAKRDMEQMLSRVAHLVGMAQQFYK